jgi:hypothetical protein
MIIGLEDNVSLVIIYNILFKHPVACKTWRNVQIGEAAPRWSRPGRYVTSVSMVGKGR